MSPEKPIQLRFCPFIGLNLIKGECHRLIFCPKVLLVVFLPTFRIVPNKKSVGLVYPKTFINGISVD